MLLIRGAWLEAGVSWSVSDARRGLLTALDAILRFEKTLADNQELGIKVLAAVSRADRSRPQTLGAGRPLVVGIDATAKRHVTRVAQGCLALAQLLRALVEDSGRPNPELLTNWQDLRGGPGRGEDVFQDLVAAFRLVQAFLERLKLSAGGGADEAGEAGPAPVAGPPEGGPAAPRADAGRQPARIAARSRTR